MFKWLGGGEKVDHPMADATRAKEIVELIAAAGPIKALGEAADWLDSITQTPGFKVDARFDGIDLVESAVRKFRQRVLDDYLACGDENQFQKNRLHNAAIHYWKSLGDAYLRCVTQIEAEKGVPGSFKPRLSLIAIRGLRAVTERMKWVQFRYGRIDAEIWKGAGIFFKFAETNGIVEQRIEIHPGVKPETSARNEFLRLMMLWAAAPGSLSPEKQDVVEWVAAYFADKFLLLLKPEAEFVYGFDLEKEQPPQRWTNRTPVNPAVRYFDAGDVAQTVASLAQSVAAMNALPAGVDLGPNKNTDITVEVLRSLATNWARTLSVRASEWRDTALTLSIMHGLEAVLGVMAPGQSAPAQSEALDFTEEPVSVTWIAENVSQGGYGAVVPAGKDDWVEVGVLLGIKSEKDKTWTVGLVRRVKSDDYDKRRVGIQLVSRAALPIELRASATSSRVHRAILLNAEPSASGSMHMLVPHNAFSLRESIVGSYGKDGEKQVTLKPAGVLETGADFVRVRFMAEFDLI